MDFQLHWQALYNALVAALTAGGNADVPVVHVDSSEEQTGLPIDPPYIIYASETLRPTGSTGGGPNKLLKDGWRITARARDLSDALEYISNIVEHLEGEQVALAGADGYTTTAITILGSQSLFETDAKLNAVHLRLEWERSK